jgi:hypothetical protein
VVVAGVARGAEVGCRDALADLGRAHDEIAATLGRAREELGARLSREAPHLATALAEGPAGAPRRGYGVLPPLVEDAVPDTVPLTERRYALPWLRDETVTLRAQAEGLGARIERSGSTELAVVLDAWERLAARREVLQGHLGYHRHWQRAAAEWPEHFAEQNAVVPALGQLRDLLRDGADPDRIERLRADLASRVAPFARPRALTFATGRAGAVVARLEVATDIEDASFLRELEASVAREYTRAQAARAARLRVVLAVRVIPAPRLYPGGPPAPGAPLPDIEAHVARFPAGCVVVTTGGATTHAVVGRYLQLGGDPISRRELAHEVGHLLGFSDAYVRGTEGETGSPDGVVLVEWSGITDDLMGSPRQGRVTAAMLRPLIDSARAGSSGRRASGAGRPPRSAGSSPR